MTTSAQRVEQYFITTNGFNWTLWHIVTDSRQKYDIPSAHSMPDLDGNVIVVFCNMFFTKERLINYIKAYNLESYEMSTKWETWDLSEMIDQNTDKSNISYIEYEEYISSLPHGKDNCFNSFDVTEYDHTHATYACQREAVTYVDFETEDPETGLSVMSRMKVCETCKQVLSGEAVTS